MAEHDEAGQGQEKTYTEAQFAGLLADKQAEVRRRQDAERKVSDLERELEERKKIDPHAPAPQNDPDNRPLTLNDLAELLGCDVRDMPRVEVQQSRAAGGPMGVTPAFLSRRRQKALSAMSDEELDRLAEEAIYP